MITADLSRKVAFVTGNASGIGLVATPRLDANKTRIAVKIDGVFDHPAIA